MPDKGIVRVERLWNRYGSVAFRRRFDRVDQLDDQVATVAPLYVMRLPPGTLPLGADARALL